MFDLTKEDIFANAVAYDPNQPQAGVYFLFHRGELVYVGQADDLHMRLKTHATDKDKEFDAYTVYDVPSDIRTEVEAHYIIEWSPKYNKIVPGNKRRGSFLTVKRILGGEREYMIARYIRDKEIQDYKGYYWLKDFDDYPEWVKSQPE